MAKGVTSLVTQFVNRLLRPLFVIVALGGAIAPSVAASPVAKAVQDLLAVFSPSLTGDYVAGVQALRDLNTTEAASFFQSAARSNWDDPVLVERAFVALAADGQIEAAAATAQRLLELGVPNELALLVVGTVALQHQRYGDTETILAAVTQDSFTAITGSILRAWAFIGDQKPAKADALLEELSKTGLADFLVFHRALMAEATGDTKKAIELAGQAYVAEPFVARIVEVLARLLANQDQYEDAQVVIDAFLAQGLTHPVITSVQEAVANKQHPGTFTTSAQVGAAEMYHGIGVALARDGNTELALVFLRLAVYLDPQGDVISLALGQLLDESGQHEMANAIYDGVPVGSVMKPTAVVRIAQNLDALGDRPEALRRLSNIVATSPDDLDAVSVLGDMLRYDEQYDQAIAAYDKALVLTGGDRPADWRFYYVRGIANERAKHWPAAEADFLKALELNPDQPAVLNYLGYSWIDQDMHLDDALAMIEKAVAATPQDGYVVDSLGWAYYKLGRDQEAVTTLEQAVQLLPNDAEINDHLGDAYLKIGRKLEARFQWNIATAMDTIGVVKARVAPKLAAAQQAIDAAKADVSTPADAGAVTEPAPAAEPSAP